MTVGNADLELAWCAFASSHKSFVLLEPSERTDVRVGEKFCKMWASLLLVAAGKRGWVVCTKLQCISRLDNVWFVEGDQTSFTEIRL